MIMNLILDKRVVGRRMARRRRFSGVIVFEILLFSKTWKHFEWRTSLELFWRVKRTLHFI